VATDSVSSVLNNRVGAQAAGNSSTNSLTLAAVTSNGTGYVENSQANSSNISALVLSGQIGIGSSTTPATVTGGVGAVLNNGVSARAFGNSSDNRLNIASVSSNVVGGISNMQVNSGGVSSMVTTTSVGIWTGAASQI